MTYKRWNKKILRGAIICGKINKFKEVLNKIKIVNDDTMNHTMNFAIRTMIHCNINNCSEFINILYDNGANISNFINNNTLQKTILHARHSFLSMRIQNKETMNDQIVNLINTLILKGADANPNDMLSVMIIESVIGISRNNIIGWIIRYNFESSFSDLIVHRQDIEIVRVMETLIRRRFRPNEKRNNTLSRAFESKNHHIIDFIGKICEPLNKCIGSHDTFDQKLTLNHAVETQDIKIVKRALELKCLPDNSYGTNNTLINSLNLECDITYELLKHGAKCEKKWISISILHKLQLFSDKTSDGFISQGIIDNNSFENISIMMCCGFGICDNWFDVLKNLNVFLNSELKNLQKNISLCYKLLNRESRVKDDQEQILELKNHLVLTMDRLYEENPEEKKLKITTLNQWINIPQCLHEIIYQYQVENLMSPKYIYWNDIL